MKRPLSSNLSKQKSLIIGNIFGQVLAVNRIGIFNAGAPFLSDLNLIFQVVIAAILVLALFAIVRRKYKAHGTMMGCTIALHTVSIFIIMIPSLLSLHGLLNDLSTRLSLLVAAHAIVGGIVEILGVLLVATWISHRTNVDDCFTRKHIMEATIVLWILEIILGFYVYTTLYPFV
jgi:uncharacterized membrane protein YozB (DUF420 family)